MLEFVESVKIWFLGLGEQYGVNPLIFGIIYVGAIPFFTLSIGWLVSNYKKQHSVVLPALSAVFFFISSYLYLIIAGQNVPFWVYLVIVVLVAGGGYSTIKKVKARLKENTEVPVE